MLLSRLGRQARARGSAAVSARSSARRLSSSCSRGRGDDGEHVQRIDGEVFQAGRGGNLVCGREKRPCRGRFATRVEHPPALQLCPSAKLGAGESVARIGQRVEDGQRLVVVRLQTHGARNLGQQDVAQLAPG